MEVRALNAGASALMGRGEGWGGQLNVKDGGGSLLLIGCEFVLNPESTVAA